jgi:predicted RNA-binding protein with PIN domain
MKSHHKTVLFVDGYNILNAWSELKNMLEVDLEGAREKLNDYMYEYAAYYDEEVYVVYDAYMTHSKKEKIELLNKVYLVFTKENQTADTFIEREVNKRASDVRILCKVATSDWVQQRQILGSGAIRMTPWELKDKCVRIRKKIERTYRKEQESLEERDFIHHSLKKLGKLFKEHEK